MKNDVFKKKLRKKKEWSSGVVVVQLYYVLFLHTSVDTHTMPSNSSEIAVAPGFYSFCNEVSSE